MSDESKAIACIFGGILLGAGLLVLTVLTLGITNRFAAVLLGDVTTLAGVGLGVLAHRFWLTDP